APIRQGFHRAEGGLPERGHQAAGPGPAALTRYALGHLGWAAGFRAVRQRLRGFEQALDGEEGAEPRLRAAESGLDLAGGVAQLSDLVGRQPGAGLGLRLLDESVELAARGRQVPRIQR